MRAKLTYANVVASLALFVALGGSSYAAIRITGHDVKNGSLTSADVKNRSLLGRDFKRGQLPRGAAGATGATGARGPAGKDATGLFAYVQESLNPDTTPAEVRYGRGVRAVNDPMGNNAYSVDFDRSLAGCVVQVVPGAGNPTGNTAIGGESTPSAVLEADPASRVDVEFKEGSPPHDIDTSFLITAFC
jgi:hypothetical protein